MKGRLLWFVLGAAVGVALAGGIAYAATARSSTVTIHACYGKKGGVLRLGTVCRKTELPVSWSQAGPPGPIGPRGPAGISGTSGAGAQGPSGVAIALTGAMAIGASNVALGSGSGLTFTGSCTAGPTIHIFAATSSGTATVAGVEVGQVLDQVLVGTSPTEVLTSGGSGLDQLGLGSNALTPIDVTVVKSDGTSYQGVVSVAFTFNASNCFISGALAH